MMLRGVFAFACVAATCWAASAAELTSTVSRENKTIVLVNGELAEGDATRLRDIIRASANSARPVSAVRFNASGGSVIEGARLAGMIQSAKFATVVSSGATCAAACFIAFAAGNEKFVSATATVGVPGASEAPSIVQVVRELGLPEMIVARMLVTRADEVFWLTQDDLRAMGAAITTGKPGQVALDQPRSVPPPSQLAPSPGSAAPDPSALKNWNDVVSAALAISREQNGGQAYTARQCGLKSNTCATAVFYTGKDGKQVMVRTIKDLTGKQLVHETCTFNERKDVRSCTDWDLGTSRRDARDEKGSWHRTTSE